MRIFEIFLKIAFVVGAIYLFFAQPTSIWCTAIFLLICLALGVVLIFNKKQSYGYKLSKREVVMRRIEGWFLILFTFVSVMSAVLIK